MDSCKEGVWRYFLKSDINLGGGAITYRSTLVISERFFHYNFTFQGCSFECQSKLRTLKADEKNYSTKINLTACDITEAIKMEPSLNWSRLSVVIILALLRGKSRSCNVTKRYRTEQRFKTIYRRRFQGNAGERWWGLFSKDAATRCKSTIFTAEKQNHLKHGDNMEKRATF